MEAFSSAGTGRRSVAKAGETGVAGHVKAQVPGGIIHYCDHGGSQGSIITLFSKRKRKKYHVITKKRQLSPMKGSLFKCSSANTTRGQLRHGLM